MKSMNVLFQEKRDKDSSWKSGRQVEGKKKKCQETTHISIHCMVALWIYFVLGRGDGGGEYDKQDREGHHITEEEN